VKGADAAKAYDDILLQFDSVQEHLLDKKTGLLYHAWDESKKKLGQTKKPDCRKFLGKSNGMVRNGNGRCSGLSAKRSSRKSKLISYIKSYTDAIIKVQDKNNGLWYQVLNKAGEKGNYTEATASSMFVYTIIKSVNNGYLPKSYKTYAKKGYDGIIKNLITVDENGVVNLNKCCAVAGLGGKPYRDGSYEYYINEEIRSNDAKGTGPFILASLEFEK
jgi:unsaturated rhamnogalacturonyl hydrolase